MYIRFRPMRICDIDECAAAIRDRSIYSDCELDGLKQLWSRIIVEGSGSAAVIEDASGVPDKRILWCCIVIFLKPQAAESLMTTTAQTIAKLVLAELSAGHTPFLSFDELKTANSSSGVHCTVLNYGAAEWAQTPELMPTVTNIVGDFIHYHISGFRMNEYIVESYSQMTSMWLEGSGMTLRRERSASEIGGTVEGEPYHRLYAVTSHEAANRQGTQVAPLFHYRRPLLGFSPAEQQMLLFALADDSYETLAGTLQLARVTINKRWQSIYDKVTKAQEKGLFLPGFQKSAAAEQSGMSESIPVKRGAERKRFVLNYLRYHMEELRPTNGKVTAYHSAKSPYHRL